MTKTKHINARVSAEIKEAVALKAKELDRSESYVVNEALKQYLSPVRLPHRSDD
jgi:predicted transcriptional regulator